MIVSSSTGRRWIMYTTPETCGADPDAPGADALLRGRVLLCDGFRPAGSLRAARVFRAAGRPVVIDVEADHGAATGALVEASDHVILSWEFVERYLHAPDPAAGARALWGRGRSVVVVTCGAQGSWVISDEGNREPTHLPAYSVEAADTTGCGDVFHGVYAALLAFGQPLVDRMRLASAAAAFVAQTGRGSVALPTLADALALEPTARGLKEGDADAFRS